MKRSIMLCALCAIILCGVGMAEAAPIKLTFTAVSVPDDAHTKAMLAFKDELEKLSNGQIVVDVFHSGQLFTQEGEQAAIKMGTVDMIYTSPSWLSQHVAYMGMFAAAYNFKSYDHMTKTFNGEIGKQIFDDVAKQLGIRPLGAAKPVDCCASPEEAFAAAAKLAGENDRIAVFGSFHTVAAVMRALGRRVT